jgi:hypothetical protein
MDSAGFLAVVSLVELTEGRGGDLGGGGGANHTTARKRGPL